MDALGVASILLSSSTSLIGNVVMGSGIETARRATHTAWSNLVNSFFTTAHFHPTDESYDWMIQWLEHCPGWEAAKVVEATTRASETEGKRVLFQPTADTIHTVWYQGHALRVKQSRGTSNSWSYRNNNYGGRNDNDPRRHEDGGRRNYDDDDDREGEPTLTITILSHSNTHDILRQLVLEAKRQFESRTVERIGVFMASPYYGGWRWKRSESKRKRPLNSVVLGPDVAEGLLRDVIDFLGSEQWYTLRGIPYRRSYLLHGPSGCGKKSLITAIASELGLDMHIIHLSGAPTKGRAGLRARSSRSSALTDDGLLNLMRALPERCIVMLEGLDAAFSTRDTPSTSKSGPGQKPTRVKRRTAPNALTLGGLLNALDGVASCDGRLLFATTQNTEVLDPALTRPGRMDIWIELTKASRVMMEGLFMSFFAESSPSISSAKSREEDDDDDLDAFRPAPTDGECLDIQARKFALAIPEGIFSMAELVGYLIGYKSRPQDAADNVGAWVQRETKDRPDPDVSTTKNDPPSEGVKEETVEPTSQTPVVEKPDDTTPNEEEEEEEDEDEDDEDSDSDDDECNDPIPILADDWTSLGW